MMTNFLDFNLDVCRGYATTLYRTSANKTKAKQLKRNGVSPTATKAVHSVFEKSNASQSPELANMSA